MSKAMQRRQQPSSAERVSSQSAWPLTSLLFLGWSIRASVAWETEGVLQPRNGNAVAYVGKFCFDKGTDTIADSVGTLMVEVTGNVPEKCKKKHPIKADKKIMFPFFGNKDPEGGVYLALFADDFDEQAEAEEATDSEEQKDVEPRHSWKQMRGNWDKVTCDEILSQAAAVREVTPAVTESLEGGEFFANVFVMQKARPRFLYFTFVFCSMEPNCDNLPISYKISALNTLRGYQSQFSMDEMGSLPLQVVGIALFTLTFFSIWRKARNFAGAGALRDRPLLKVLLLSTALSTTSCIFISLHNAVYAFNGRGLGVIQVMGELCACVGRLCLTLLQVIVATGKVLQQHNKQDYCQTFVLMGAIVLCTLGCELYGRYFGDLDWSTTLYFYESWPGLTLLGLNAVLFLKICCDTWGIFRQPDMPPSLRPFYVKTFAIAIVYFLALPGTCVLAYLLDPWDRKIVVACVRLATQFVVTVALVFCLWPSNLDPLIGAYLESPDRREVAIELATHVPMTSQTSDGHESAAAAEPEC